MHLGGPVGHCQTQLDGLKTRALKATARPSNERRWLYALEWCPAAESLATLTTGVPLQLLLVGHMSEAASLCDHSVHCDAGGETVLECCRWDAVVVLAALQRQGSSRSMAELRVLALDGDNKVAIVAEQGQATHPEQERKREWEASLHGALNQFWTAGQSRVQGAASRYEFDFEELKNYRSSWGFFRDRREELY